ncbi:UNVERIFIED_CONTAM: protein NRT1/ PTR FAMILY 1.2, partial [Sesamum angustifolium]
MEMATASNILFLWTAANNFMPVLGAAIADSYLGRGWFFLWSTALIAQERPPPCDQSSDSCSSPTFLQSMVLCSSLGLIAVGSGGIRASSMAFGADQLENADGKENSSVGDSYFSWFLNKACIVRDPQKDLMPDRRARDPWSLCTVDQVEELKALLRVADGFNDFTQSEFYYSELPRSMSSIASNLNGLGFAVGSLLASLVMNMVNSISKAGGRQGWISSDINKGRYDYYYLVLAGLSM